MMIFTQPEFNHIHGLLDIDLECTDTISVTQAGLYIKFLGAKDLDVDLPEDELKYLTGMLEIDQECTDVPEDYQESLYKKFAV